MAEGDPNFDDTMDNVVKQIYSHCDPNNIDLVPATDLIAFVKQFMPEHPEEIGILRAQLDPNDENPNISRRRFSEIMEIWTVKLKEKFSSDDEEANSNTVDNNQEPTSDEEIDYFNETTTSRSNLDYQISTYTNVAGNNETITRLEDENKDLQHQLHKLKNELEMSKQQITASEDLNEYLQTDLTRIASIHKMEVNSLQELLKDAKCESEQQKEESLHLTAQMQQLEQDKANLAKELKRVEKHTDIIEKDKLNLERRLQIVQRRDRKTRSECEKLRKDLFERDLDITELNKAVDVLKVQLDKQKELVKFYKNENALAKEKTLASEQLYEKYLSGKCQENNSIFNELVQSVSNTACPDEHFSTFQYLYNSPQPQLSNAKPPNLTLTTKSNQNVKGIMVKTLLINSCSTPVIAKTFDFEQAPESPLFSPIKKCEFPQFDFPKQEEPESEPVKVDCSVQTEETGAQIADLKSRLRSMEQEKLIQTCAKMNLEKLWLENATTIRTCEDIVTRIFQKFNAQIDYQQCDLIEYVTTLSHVVDDVVNKIHNLNRQIEHLTKQIEGNAKIKALESDLKAKNEQLIEFMAASNSNLRESTSNILHRIDLHNKPDGFLLFEQQTACSSTLEEQMHNLNNNIKLVIQLLELLAENSGEKPHENTLHEASISPYKSNIGVVAQFGARCFVLIIFVVVSFLYVAQWECYNDGPLRRCPFDICSIEL